MAGHRLYGRCHGGNIAAKWQNAKIYKQFKNSNPKHRLSEAPNSKHQAPEKLQTSKLQFAGLVLEVSLVLGCWDLDVPNAALTLQLFNASTSSELL
jgi:hypothetical protein